MITKTDKYDGYIKDYPSYSTAEQTFYKFPNGYGASVIYGKYTYGLEVAVIKWNENDDSWDIDYSTPITNDVIRHVEELDLVLNKIYDLPVNSDTYDKDITLSDIEDIIYRENTFTGLKNALAEYLELEVDL